MDPWHSASCRRPTARPPPVLLLDAAEGPQNASNQNHSASRVCLATLAPLLPLGRGGGTEAPLPGCRNASPSAALPWFVQGCCPGFGIAPGVQGEAHHDFRVPVGRGCKQRGWWSPSASRGGVWQHSKGRTDSPHPTPATESAGEAPRVPTCREHRDTRAPPLPPTLPSATMGTASPHTDSQRHCELLPAKEWKKKET